MNRQLKPAICILINCAVIGICLIAALYVCAHKAGFHEDEYYTYYSSNRTEGFWVEDGELMSRQTILNEFSVVPGEGFNFGLVKEVQSWDVHPPVYYFLVHFICSLSPGVFNPWQGLILNLICYAISLILLMWLVKLLLPERKLAPAVSAAVFGLSAAALTAVAFIRMYMLLSVWILAVTILHVNYLQQAEKRKYPFYIKLGVLTFLGFMTHYYFFIWLFFLAVCINLYETVKTRKVIGIVKYGVTMIAAFGLSYAFYPAWPAQMFKGQRGSQATGNFLDIGNTFERIGFFAEKVNRIGFGGLLWIIALVIISLAVAVKIKNKKRQSDVTGNTSSEYICVILLVSAILYFLAVSKTALMLGDSSIRYQMPVLGVAVAALAVLITMLYKKLELPERYFGPAAGVLAAILIVCNVAGDFTGNISFLYPEEKEHARLIEESANAGIVYIYNEDPTQSWCIWDSAEEFLKFDEVLFIAADSDAELSDEAKEYIASKDTLFTYVDCSVDTAKVINKTQGRIDGLSTNAADYSHEYCDVYILKQ